MEEKELTVVVEAASEFITDAIDDVVGVNGRAFKLNLATDE